MEFLSKFSSILLQQHISNASLCFLLGWVNIFLVPFPSIVYLAQRHVYSCPLSIEWDCIFSSIMLVLHQNRDVLLCGFWMYALNRIGEREQPHRTAYLHAVSILSFILPVLSPATTVSLKRDYGWVTRPIVSFPSFFTVLKPASVASLHPHFFQLSSE